MIQRTNATDALIVGGGPAGLAAAIALRQKGMDCLVVDALEPPIEKGCGEGLMPDTLLSLEKLGVTLSQDEGHPFRGIRFINPSHQVDACFPNGIGIGMRRTQLHHRMHDRARSAGAKFAWGSHVKLAGNGKVAVDGVEMRFRWLIGADGTASRVRRWAGLEASRAVSERFGFRRHYQVAPWSEYVEVHWGEIGQVYVTPVAANQVCVVLITRNGGVDRENFLNWFPAVARRVEKAAILTPQRAAVTATRRLTRVAKGSVALIGDASGSVDAITGEGLAMTFRQAMALAESLEAGTLDEYVRVHPTIGKLPHAMSKLMLTMDRWPVLQGLGIKALAGNQALFADLLSVHVGVGSIPKFALRRGPSLGWNLLTALGQS